MEEWQDRVVSFGRKPANQFLAHERNARTHPAKQRIALRGSLETIGNIGVIIENAKSGKVIDGHARIEEALTLNEDMELAYVLVDLEPHEEAQALASYDFITYLAEYDRDNLDSLLRDVQSDDERVQALLGDLASEHDMYETLSALNDDGRYDELLADANEGLYTRKVEAPIYEPSGEKPHISDLYDNSKTRNLIAEIESSAHLSDEEREFLITAAQRHTVLNFSKIANFYAHSNPDVQKLMEDSALVIIDFNRAIELGFVKLTRDIAELERGIYD